MADDASGADDAAVTFNVKSSSDKKFVLTLPQSTTIGDLKSKLASTDYADLPPERQRLIYSGRVLKDHETLGSYKIKDGNTVHLVKGAASNERQNAASQSTSQTIPGAGGAGGGSNVPTNLASGTGNNPLAGLTGARYAGFHQLPGADMFGPDGGMGPPPDPEQMLTMLENPMFQAQMNEALQNPAVIEMMSNNPMMRNIPGAREMMQNPEFRRMLTDPQMIRMQLQMQRAAGGLGGGQNAFPAPGVTDTTPQQESNGQPGNNSQQQQQPPNPFAMFGNPSAGGANPFAALFNQGTAAGTTPTSVPPTSSTDQGTPASAEAAGAQSQQPNANPFGSLFGMAPSVQGQQNQQQQQQQTAYNPFSNPIMQSVMQNPEAMRQLMQVFGGGGAGMGVGNNPGVDGRTAGQQQQQPGFNPFAMLGAMGGDGLNAAPPDNRPPEERYAEQLRQLNDMGFFEFERNVQALRRSGGSVQGAVEYLLSGV